MTDSNELTLHLTITGNQGAPRVPLKIARPITPTELRLKVSETTKIPLSSIRLIYRGKLIREDASTDAVAEYNLEEDSVIHVMGKPVETSAAAAAAIPPSAAATPTAFAAGSTVTIQPSTSAAASIPSFLSGVAAPADPLLAAFQTLRLSNPPAEYQTAVITLDKILTNIILHPLEAKYRKVKKQNPAFQRRLGGLTGGDAAMTAAGFLTQLDNGEEVYMLEASADAWPRLTATKQKVETAVREATAATAARLPNMAAPQQPMAPSFPGGIPNFGDLGAHASPEMNNAMANLLADPNALQSMMQNPMVQQMIRSDPRMASNPMLQRAMEELATNPAAANQMSQILRDPVMMQQMQTMMQQRQQNPQQNLAFGGMGLQPQLQQQGTSNTANGTLAQPGNNNSGTNQGSSGPPRSDEEMTEEEMIAEAIRRSMQDP